jgi:hypothetical protein
LWNTNFKAFTATLTKQYKQQLRYILINIQASTAGVTAYKTGFYETRDCFIEVKNILDFGKEKFSH